MATLETHRMEDIVRGLTTKSDKIRALDAAGFERADIARFLDIRYQHVRNVLVAPHPASKPQSQTRGTPTPSEKPSAPASIRGRIQIGAGGRIVIPAEMRAAMRISEGDTLLGRIDDGELRLFSQDTAVRKAQEIVRQYVPEGVSLVDELIAERREEARKEADS